MTAKSQTERQQKAVKEGFLCALATIIVFFIAYQVNPQWFFHQGLWLGSFLIYFFFMFRSVQIGEGITFRENLRDPFICFIIANAAFYLFYYLMISQIDPSLQDSQWAILQESGHLPSDAKKEDYAPNVSGLFLQFARSLIVGFGLAAGITFIARRRAGITN